ncbi:MAG TPA: leucine--tRNA ligase [Pyrinomonadaceae bacterium]|nr:leucine--tRNA ligase [Pyrinomonadaceae bacterium]
MDEKYFAQKIERKWQRRWAENKTFEARIDKAKEKFYALEMLPYPSGRLHMGHVRNYSIGDALAWYKRLQGFNVLHPIGWDSFGQPAEQAAIKKGVNPRAWTEDNINQMREQLQRLGISYDWSREIAAHRPEYYKFDQWFFLKMLERGLAYKKMTKVNWCPRDQTTLSNEQASGGVCWRCGTQVEKKDIAQWFLRITAYAEELLQGMKQIETGWAERVLTMQRNWIGKSEGAFVEFKVQGSKFKVDESPEESLQSAVRSPQSVKVFTTRIDTIYGANALVVAAEHPIVEANFGDFSDAVKNKIEEIKIEKAKPTDYGEEVEKDGVDTGLKAVNPFSGEQLPVWVGNYVMMEYGTGAVMSVPAHDERDFEFAKRFNLPVKQVVSGQPSAVSQESEDRRPKTEDRTFTDYGVLINSGEWTSKTSEEAKREMTRFAEEHNFGEAATTYRLRDWGISRQRFWGAPIPIIYCESCGTVPVPYENLPVELPESAPFTGVGESPLAKVPAFVNTSCPNCNESAKRETDTMDTFVDSTWYYFRYSDPHNTEMPFDPEIARYWLPVDQYIGGVDHAVMHLLYTRFWTKVMRDIGLVDFDEPVKNLLTQGMVVGESYYSEEKASYFPQDEVEIERDERGKILSAKLKDDDSPVKVAIEKMSKSKYNGVDPDDMVLIYGADAARIFALFAAPAENELVWQETGIEGAVRFLQRVWRFVYRWHEALSGQQSAVNRQLEEVETGGDARKLRQKTHRTIKRITENMESFQFNTPVAALMELSNSLLAFERKNAYQFSGAARKGLAIPIDDFEVEECDVPNDGLFAVGEAVRSLILMLAPYAPHVSEELWEIVTGNTEGILSSNARFPVPDENLARAGELEIPIQINGKLRSRVTVAPETAKEQLEALALADAKIREYTDGRQIVKIIVVPNRLVNIVVK